MQTADVYPDAGYDETYFMTFDTDTTIPHFHELVEDETIGNIHRVTGGAGRAAQTTWNSLASDVLGDNSGLSSAHPSRNPIAGSISHNFACDRGCWSYDPI
jgi:hypothetical protein